MHNSPHLLLRLWKFIIHPLTRYVLAWLVAAGTVSGALWYAWTVFDDQRRNDRNGAHAFIDFGGQWVMGRMLVDGHGHSLYRRQVLREVVSNGYPRDDEVPPDKRQEDEKDKHDAEELMRNFMGKDEGEAIGGPLYPPINGFFFYPLALLKPQHAYHCNQVVGMLLAFVAAWAIRQLSEGRIWWPVAITAVIAFPGFMGSLNLGQNAALTLAVLLGGWVLAARGHPVWAGVVWGLLAFKPVWAASFFLVPLLTRRWRMGAAMLASAAALGAVTLPVVGWQSWLDWLHVGAEATSTYKFDQNWIELSRDLLSTPRRWLDFKAPAAEQEQLDLPMTLIGWSSLVAVLELTVRWALLRQDRVRSATGPGPAFVLFGAWLICFHFMYYDVLLAALPVALLFTEPGRYLRPLFVAVVLLPASQLSGPLEAYYRPRLARTYPASVPLVAAGRRHIWVRNRMFPTLVVVLLGTQALVSFRLPYDTLCLLGFWLWCGWLLARAPAAAGTPPEEQAASVDLAAPTIGRPQLVELETDVRSAH